MNKDHCRSRLKNGNAKYYAAKQNKLYCYDLVNKVNKRIDVNYTYEQRPQQTRGLRTRKCKVISSKTKQTLPL